MKQISSQTGICFFRLETAMELKAFLNHVDFTPLELKPTAQDIDEWLHWGCIYVDGQRRRENAQLLPGQVIRLHTRPKKYPSLPLRERIVSENAHFLVLDKPAGLPTHPTLDNYLENAKVQLEAELGQKLFVTHRLDVPTQGLLVIAKTAEDQVKINHVFSLGRVGKTYRCLCLNPVRPGSYVHFIDPKGRVPRPASSLEQDDWWRCELRVDRCEPQSGFFAHEITLLTGKTHQIRTQMRALGAPLSGDVVYGGPAADALMLECYRLEFALRGHHYIFTRHKALVEL